MALLLVVRSASADDVTPPAPAHVFELAGDRVIVRGDAGEASVVLGCQPRSFASLASTAYALCAPNTVLVVSAEPAPPRVLERRHLRDTIVSLTVVDGVVSARTANGVQPLDEMATAVEPRPHHVLRAPSSHTRHAVVNDNIRGFEGDLDATGCLGFDGPLGAAGFLQGAFVYREAPLWFAAYGTLGAGTASFDAAHRQTGPIGGDVQVAAAEAVVGIESRFVAVGAGVGVALLDQGYNVSPLVVGRLRFGEIDGFTVSLHFTVATTGGDAAGVYGGAIEFRVRSRLWLGFDAELGAERYGRLMLDLRHRLHGEGGGHTVDLRLGIGLAYVHTSPACQTLVTSDVMCTGNNADYIGPALSAGFVFR